MKQRTHEEFIKKLDEKHPNRDWEVIGEYEHNTIPILVRDKYGDCLIPPNNLMQRSKPSVRTAIDKTAYIINKFKDVWGEDMFDYSEFEYKGVRVKSILICKSRGHRFLSDTNNHLAKRGCPDCAKEAIGDRLRSNKKEFVEKAVKKYGLGKFSFTKTVYNSAIEEVVITCKKHGDFKQTPNRFLTGSICPRCAYKESTANFHTLKKKRNKSLMYIIECYNDKERFIKMGVTTRTIEKRFRDKYDMPYEYKILREFEYANINAPDELETKLLSFTKNAIYYPTLSFNGETEARIISIKKPLLELFDVLTDKLYYMAFFNFTKAYNGVFDKSILNSGNYSDLEVNTVMRGLDIHTRIQSGIYSV